MLSFPEVFSTYLHKKGTMQQALILFWRAF